MIEIDPTVEVADAVGNSAAGLGQTPIDGLGITVAELLDDHETHACV